VVNVPTVAVSAVTVSPVPGVPPQGPSIAGPIVGSDEIDRWGQQAVRSHGPIADRPPIRPQERSAPSRPLQTGDLECSSCGEACPPEMSYCRRCGRSLKDARVVGPSRWQKLKSKLESEKEPPI
jgi:hypothetical protein